MTMSWKKTVGAVVGFALLAGTGAAVVTAREQGPGGPGRFAGRRGPGGPGGPGGMLPGLRGLELSESQREQVKATMAAHQATFESQRTRLGAAHQALQAAVTAPTFDEAAVRQKAAELAAIEADGAVLRAKVHSEVWALLTPEQQAKATAQKAQRAERANQRLQKREQRRGQRQPARQGD